MGKLLKRNISSFSLCNGGETQKLWKPLLTQFSLSEAHRNVLHNETWNISFVQFANTAKIYFFHLYYYKLKSHDLYVS